MKKITKITLLVGMLTAFSSTAEESSQETVADNSFSSWITLFCPPACIEQVRK